MSWLSRFLPKSKPTDSSAPVFFTNTLTGKKEVFSPQKAGTVSMYSCGPTVYSRAHIGNLRAYVLSDLAARVLKEAGYRVHRAINITDVGHLVSEGDEGEDKMEVGARREGVSVLDIANRYTSLFLEDIEALNIRREGVTFPRATEFIKEQIEMIKELEAKGATYRTSDGIYFDTSMFPGYGKLGGVADAMRKEVALADLGRRISENKEKRHPADFALWKFSPEANNRLQEWGSPWGMGFPGWHIECSAMAKSLLGTTLDIHTGGMDHIPIHHNNEIAQSEMANGRPLARYWLHGAFLNVESEKISKSLGNSIYLSGIEERGYHPLALRYLFLQAHYRSPMDFNWEALGAANEALHRLWRLTREAKADSKGRSLPSDESRRMVAILRDDLATPQALALLWEAVKDEDLDPAEVWGVIEAAEPVLGLLLTNPPAAPSPVALPADIQALAENRDEARKDKDFARADEIRMHIEERGYRVEDGPSGTVVTPRPR
ncbi:MAG TPA: cysteine--tRNA ligase [Candidatus Paceibacterota bacterium]|nr:cysteine--tRNA ligase [Candidatus Paceibacterota bacterium]